MEEPSGILIKGGKVVNEDCSVIGDVYIENGKIVEVGLNLQIPKRVRVIDATDKLVIPGGIDTHTHMELAFMGTRAVDDFHIGTKVEFHLKFRICHINFMLLGKICLAMFSKSKKLVVRVITFTYYEWKWKCMRWMQVLFFFFNQKLNLEFESRIK